MLMSEVLDWKRFGATENVLERAKLLKGLVGAWGFEPQTPTVSSSALPWANLLKSTSTKFPKENFALHPLLQLHVLHIFVCQTVCPIYIRS